MAVHRGCYLKLVGSVIEIDGFFSYASLEGGGLLEIELEEDIYFEGSCEEYTRAWANALKGVIVRTKPTVRAMACEGTMFAVHSSRVEILRYVDDDEKT